MTDINAADIVSAGIEYARMEGELAELREELDGTYRANGSLGDLMRAVCDALKGEPPEHLDMWYSTHDLAEWAGKAAAVANAALALGAPFANDIQVREDFVLAVAAWQALFAQQIKENAEIEVEIAAMEKPPTHD